MVRSGVLVGLILAATSAPALAQATSGGQTPQPGGSMESANSYNSSNITTQYIQQQQLGNLPAGQQSVPGQAGRSQRSRPATKAELTPGAVVNDKTGTPMAKIDEVDADGVVVSMGTAKVKVPAEAFGHNKAGLLLDLTKAQFEQVIAQAK